jgi:DNA-binding NtrC family response regulator
MQHSASSTRAGNWKPPSRNKLNVGVSSSAAPSLIQNAGVSETKDVSVSASQWNLDHDQIEHLDARHVFISVSQGMRDVRRQLEQVARIEAPVLLVGETGTGRELAARLIHKFSGGAEHEFRRLNCGAVPAEQLARELFGRDLDSSSPGLNKVETAKQGTLFLDDITALPASLQPGLLQILQAGEFRIGGRLASEPGLRIIGAANSDIRQAIHRGAFRADLYYRLNTFTIQLPPLRDRNEDLPYLLSHFMNISATDYQRPSLPITRRILEAGAAHNWPGNLRELENFIKRYLITTDENSAINQLEMETDPQPDIPVASPALPVHLGSQDVCNLKSVVRDLKQEAEKAAILQALERTSGNKQEAAGLLHISLRALHYKVRAYRIDSTASRSQACVDFPDPAARFLSLLDKQLKRENAGKVLTMARSNVPPVR